MENLIFEKIIGKDENSLKLVYFKIEALQKYFTNPKYRVFFSDYRGKIIIKEEYLKEDNDFEEVRDFGIAYKKANNERGAVVLFAGDIVGMNEQTRAHWFSYCINDQTLYYPNQDFIRNLIYGEWAQNISIYSALLMEIQYINECCKAMSLPNLFRKEFNHQSLDSSSKPSNYHLLILPTEYEYENFVLTLAKMITDNINTEVFVKCTYPFIPVKGTTKDKNGNTCRKGSKTLLKEWLKENNSCKVSEEDIIKPLQSLIKKRQIPGHSIIKDNIDNKYWKRQDDLIASVYKAVRFLRLLFKNHPLTASVEINPIISKGENIVIY